MDRHRSACRIAFGFAVAASLVALVAGCSGETLDAAYADRSEAATAGAIERGWIPRWLPADATALHEAHELDGNRSALAFALPGVPRWTPPSSCRPAPVEAFAPPLFERGWIPDTRDGYDHYRCDDEAETSPPLVAALALRRDGRHALFWRSPVR